MVHSNPTYNDEYHHLGNLNVGEASGCSGSVKVGSNTLPQLFFLSETKKRNTNMKCLYVLWQFDNCLLVDCFGRSGGLALIWMNTLSLEVKSFLANHIDAFVRDYSTVDFV